MKSFRNFISEEVLPSVQVADGSLDISKPAVRAAINAAIAGVVSQPAVTPYVVFNRLSKLLAQYHIVLPKRFLEGDKGVEVFELKQFGHRMGMTDSGEFINEVPTTHYLFLQYGILTPMGVTYAKPLVGGMFRVTARLVDKAELDKLLDMAEITMSEEAEVRQKAAKAMAPKEDPHTALGDCDCSQGDSPSTKKAVKVSMKKIDEDKDPCWKGYEMVGMKKKGGRKVPNCVPVEEEKSFNEMTPSEKMQWMKDQVQKGKEEKKRLRKSLREKPKKNIKEEQIDEVSAGLARRAAHHAFVKSDKMKADAKKEPDMHSYVQAVHKGEKKSKQGIKFAKYAAKKMEEAQIDEKAPPGAKFERMVKHIKKGYSKDGLTAKEKSIAYATAWKAKKREENK
jgi:hypothetical protein